MSIRISHIEELFYVYGIDIFSFFQDKDMTVSQKLVGVEQIAVVLSDYQYEFDSLELRSYVMSGQAQGDILKLVAETFEESKKVRDKKSKKKVPKAKVMLNNLKSWMLKPLRQKQD